MVSDATKWSEWQLGKVYDLRFAESDVGETVDWDAKPDPTFRIRIEIRKRATGKLFTREGKGRLVSFDYTPITFTFKGRTMYFSTLLNLED